MTGSSVEEVVQVALAQLAEFVIVQPVLTETDPVRWYAQSLAHHASVGAVPAERLLDALYPLVGDEAEDMPDFVHSFGFDATRLQIGIKLGEAVDRDQSRAPGTGYADYEVIVVFSGIQIRGQDNHIVMRVCLVERLII